MSAAEPQPISARWLITEAFSALLAAHPFDKISVHAIVRKAGISRSTFYLHFQDKYDLMEQVTQEIAGELLRLYEGHAGGDEKQLALLLEHGDKLAIPGTIAICEHFRAHAGFYRNRFRDPGFLSWLTDELRLRFLRIYGDDARATFAAGGTMGFYGRWLAEGMPGSTLEVAQQLVSIAQFSMLEAQSLQPAAQPEAANTSAPSGTY
ncbi:TetR family transcriptional regulator [Cohnella fermenti]|uniref:TetR family transcriptional regulator n=1 Tax=Cohnella fermenti TaxID=2565925 RepID=A0A4S4BYF3_9BACL|nr:TetR family transcriptional regulator [Cohnella fermenti]THF79582.1 TetR family transcriptional regulator [Cohnella fermenti]